MVIERRRLLVGAWKAYLNNDRAVALARAIRAHVNGEDLGFDLAVCPSFISIVSVQDILRDSVVATGAQNVFWAQKNGAYTSQITAQQLAELNCPYTLVGHSELRQLGETDEFVNGRTRTALAYKMQPIVCVGESSEDRRGGRAESKVGAQVLAALKDVCVADVNRVIFAYEPLWAIKSESNPDAVPATSEQANEMHASIREMLRRAFGTPVADSARILYGGSVGPDNASAFARQHDIDGMLVGSASVSADSFLGIIDALRAVVD